MSEPENFIARWSRRKAAAQDPARPVAAPDNGGTPADDGEGPRDDDNEPEGPTDRKAMAGER